MVLHLQNFLLRLQRCTQLSNAGIWLAALSPWIPAHEMSTGISSSQPPTWPTKVPCFLPGLQKNHVHFWASSPYSRRLVAIPRSQLLEEGNVKERNVFLMALSADDYHPFLDAGICLSQNKKWRKQHFDQKAFFFQRAIQNYFRVPMVHVDTAITRDISNPNWRECKSISPEEDLPGHFWVPWVTARY